MQKLLVEKYFNSLKDRIESDDYKGWDPFDGLNSKVFQKSPFRRSRFFRLIWIQFFKISPVNFRRLFLVPKQYNAKGLGLLLTGYCNKYNQTNSSDDLATIRFLVSKILELKSPGYSGSCWGYNFDWQARAFFQPKGTPTIVATSFVANALLDAYELLKDDQLLKEARSSCDFILEDLNRTHTENGDFCFSYSPLDNTQVFNASVLGSRLLARVFSYTQEDELIVAAKLSIDFCLPFQQENGAWPYGTLPYHQWVDNFHTGYMIECISEYQKYAGGDQYDEVISKSLDYYLKTFFEESGIPKYYNNKRYPIDIHAPAQLLVTLFRIGKLNENKELVDKVLKWVHKNMWDKRGFYYYQKRKWWTSKIPYMRWAQAWMFYALSYYNREFDK
ncbi:MAG TPA: delta-aminolevulinic acid dehydratase [Epulopiscium sp.]|nr:delta-aminolevulinic acid dehydratase [Candidatus Epulonipiscium sp.]